MIEPDRIKGIIFDYGGTIDSNGVHWAEVIWEAYTKEEVPVSKETFRKAYVHGERTLGKNPIVKPHHTFLDMLRMKTDLQIEWLKAEDLIAEAFATEGLKRRIADRCYAYARKSIDAARPVIDALAQRYPLVLVSNFYGNIKTVLEDFHLDRYFGDIVESAVVGIRKPDPAIFSLGVKALSLEAGEVAVVGDSYDKDIIPATALGCRTVWLKNVGWSDYSGDEKADAVISDFSDLEGLFRLKK